MNPDADHLIVFTLVYRGEEYTARTVKGEYRSLLGLIRHYFSIPNYGTCRGTGNCGACQVEIYDGAGNLNRGFLSCNIHISACLANTKIVITEQPY